LETDFDFFVICILRYSNLADDIIHIYHSCSFHSRVWCQFLFPSSQKKADDELGQEFVSESGVFGFGHVLFINQTF
jgi:hypothetical protein